MTSTIEQLRKQNPYTRTFDDKVAGVAHNIQYAAYDTKCEIQKQFPQHQSRIDLLMQIENAINFVGETVNFYQQVENAGNLHGISNCRDHEEYQKISVRAVKITNRNSEIMRSRWIGDALRANAPKADELTPETDNICKVCGRSEYYGTANFTTIRGGDVCDDCI